ncbi:hypothetical protein RB195_008860 [Necator americanus]|uniref:Neurotransmitter-gated ion-channel ligand binding domain protein n=1 Tax=Necator americanus TaxID=51031 RepID=A0ABR1CQQ2_NECAM
MLLDELFPFTYETSVRPGSNDSATVVTIVPNKLVLLYMDQLQETIQFSEEFLLTWIDPLLSWDINVTEYSRPWIKIPETNLWAPGIIFTAAIEINEMMPIDERMADLRYDGTVRVSNPSVVTYPCPLRIDSFPYDVQVCNLTIGAWNFDADEVIVKSYTDHIEGAPQQFEGNSEWELSSIRAFREMQPDSDGSMYSVVIYQVELKRKPVYYVLVIQIPTLIMTTLTIFGIFTPFSNTPERREKVTLGLNMFVSISMMLNLVADMMPKASRLPLLGNYILSQIFVCSAAVLVSIVTLIFHQRCHTRCHRPPKWLLNVLFCQCRRNRTQPIANDPPPYSVCKRTPSVEILESPEILEVLQEARAGAIFIDDLTEIVVVVAVVVVAVVVVVGDDGYAMYTRKEKIAALPDTLSPSKTLLGADRNVCKIRSLEIFALLISWQQQLCGQPYSDLIVKMTFASLGSAYSIESIWCV